MVKMFPTPQSTSQCLNKELFVGKDYPLHFMEPTIKQIEIASLYIKQLRYQATGWQCLFQRVPKR